MTLTLATLSDLLVAFAAQELTLDALRARFLPLLHGDALGAERADATPWEESPHEERLLWRLVHLYEHEVDDETAARRLACHVVRCLARTDADSTFELLPLLRDQERLATIVARHRAGVISRTGFLNVLARAGYPPHAKLWLEHAPPEALARLVAMLDAEAYDVAAATLENAP